MTPLYYLIKLVTQAILSRFLVFCKQSWEFFLDFRNTLIISMIDGIIDDLESYKSRFIENRLELSQLNGYKVSKYTDDTISFELICRFIDIGENLDSIRLYIYRELPNNLFVIEHKIMFNFVNTKTDQQFLHTVVSEKEYRRSELFEWVNDITFQIDEAYGLHAGKKCTKFEIKVYISRPHKSDKEHLIEFGQFLYHFYIGRFIDAVMACKARELTRNQIELMKRFDLRDKMLHEYIQANINRDLTKDYGRYAHARYVFCKRPRSPQFPLPVSPPHDPVYEDDVVMNFWILIKGQAYLTFMACFFQYLKIICMLLIIDFVP